jgi:superfamily I DNA and RNA helicase
MIILHELRLKATCFDLLKKHPLPRDCHWLSDTLPKTQNVRVDSVHRFKGLEAAVVIIWGLDNLDPNKHREVFYVGFSRARSELHLVGQPEKCRHLLSFPG